MTRHSNLVSLTMLLGLAACGSGVEYTRTNAPPRPVKSTTVDLVEVFTTGSPPSTYVEIGIIRRTRDSAMTDSQVIIEMKSEAAKHGCNALVVTQFESTEATASCIVYVVP